MKFKLNAETVRAVLQAEAEVLFVDEAPNSSLDNPAFVNAVLVRYELNRRTEDPANKVVINDPRP